MCLLGAHWCECRCVLAGYTLGWLETIFFFFQSILLAIQSLYIADIVDDPRTQHDASVLFANAGTSRYSAFSSPLSSTPFFPPPLDPLSVCFPSLHHFSFLFVQGQQLKIGGTLIGTSHPQLQHSILTTAKMKATSTQIWHFQSLMGSAVRPQV